MLHLNDLPVCAILPDEGTIFLKQAFERTASRTTVQPDQYLIISGWIVGWKEPEVELADIIFIGDGEKACVRLANVEVYEWDIVAIDLELGGIGVLRYDRSL